MVVNQLMDGRLCTYNIEYYVLRRELQLLLSYSGMHFHDNSCHQIGQESTPCSISPDPYSILRYVLHAKYSIQAPMNIRSTQYGVQGDRRMFLVRYFVHGVNSFAPLNCPHKSLVLSDFSVLQGCHCSLFRTLVEGRRGPNDKQTFPQLIINFFLIIFSFSYTSTVHVRFDLMNSRLSPCLIKTFPSAINIGERIETTDVGIRRQRQIRI